MCSESLFWAHCVQIMECKNLIKNFGLRPPEGITLRRITEHHDIEKVNSAWSQRDSTSFEYIQSMAKYNVNVGAYKDDGTLVAWVFRYKIDHS